MTQRMSIVFTKCSIEIYYTKRSGGRSREVREWQRMCWWLSVSSSNFYLPLRVARPAWQDPCNFLSLTEWLALAYCRPLSDPGLTAPLSNLNRLRLSPLTGRLGCRRGQTHWHDDSRQLDSFKFQWLDCSRSSRVRGTGWPMPLQVGRLRVGEPAPAGGNCQPDSESLAHSDGLGLECHWQWVSVHALLWVPLPPPARICQYMPVYASICKYMHVYARMCRWSGQKTTKCEKHVCARICTYMHVYECIWKYDGIRYRKCPFSVSPPLAVGCTHDVSSWWSATAV